jgi:hypothetical protein
LFVFLPVWAVFVGLGGNPARFFTSPNIFVLKLAQTICILPLLGDGKDCVHRNSLIFSFEVAFTTGMVTGCNC